MANLRSIRSSGPLRSGEKTTLSLDLDSPAESQGFEIDLLFSPELGFEQVPSSVRVPAGEAQLLVPIFAGDSPGPGSVVLVTAIQRSGKKVQHRLLWEGPVAENGEPQMSVAGVNAPPAQSTPVEDIRDNRENEGTPTQEERAATPEGSEPLTAVTPDGEKALADTSGTTPRVQQPAPPSDPVTPKLAEDNHPDVPEQATVEVAAVAVTPRLISDGTAKVAVQLTGKAPKGGTVVELHAEPADGLDQLASEIVIAEGADKGKADVKLGKSPGKQEKVNIAARVKDSETIQVGESIWDD